MALILKESLRDIADFGIWKIEEDNAYYESKLIFSSAEKKYVESIKNEKRKTRWLASRWLLKYLMNTDRFVELLFDVHGKPFINNFNFNVSISHSEQFAAVIISQGHEVGIDIEEPARNIENLQSKFLSPVELLQIQHELRNRQLLVYWSAKEVMYKIYGKRKLEFKDDMFVKPFMLNKRGELQAMLMKNGGVSSYMMQYIQDKHYTVVVGSDADVSVVSDNQLQ